MGQNSDISTEGTQELGALKTKNEPFVPAIIWSKAIGFALIHLGALYGWYLMLSGTAMLLTTVYAIIIALICGLSITVGAHRLWSHRSFKAKLPLQLLCLIFNTIAGQDSVWVWVRNHRLHHKYTDTDADPHNSTRGFFFSHIGWLMMQKHPEVTAKIRQIDMSDLGADPWIMYQKRHYVILYLVFAILIPIAIPCYFWNETIWNSFMIGFLARYTTQLNVTWSVNSFAHIYGTRPYDKNIRPVENAYVSAIALGEGWHNYHHAFPWDCNAAELGRGYNISGTFINLMERIGQAYDLKRATRDMTMHRVQKYGDGTHPVNIIHLYKIV